MLRKLPLGILFFFLGHFACAQFLMDMVDTSKDLGRGMLNMYSNFNHIRIGGYIQPQFQFVDHKGAKSYAGGNFDENVNNRFMLRRGRIRFDYINFRENKGPSVQFVFQFDGTERGVFIRDFWGRIFENRWKSFSLTAGMFARPFSYELNLSSSDRESPERGRMSQILMKTERDLGTMLTFSPSDPSNPLHYFKWDLGFFNGQGLAATADFDSKKDFITRLALKPIKLSGKLTFGAAASLFEGGMLQNTPYVFSFSQVGGMKQMLADSSVTNKGAFAPRRYYGADMQLKFKTKAGFTEFRLEGILGTQTGTQTSTETPAKLLVGKEGYYIRSFNGAYFYLLHNIVNSRHQLIIKYDWYDPNARISGREIANGVSNFSEADIKFSTLGIGYTYYINNNIKWTIYYDRVYNESTALSGFEDDLMDNVLTSRLQFRF